MTEAIAKAKPAAAPKAAPAAAKPIVATSIPSIAEMGKMEVPAAVREIAEKGVEQAKETYAKVKAATEEATEAFEGSYTTAAKGVAEFNQKALEAARTNLNAAFEFASDLFKVKSLSETIELQSTFARKQLETLQAQSKDLSSLAQKVANDASAPLKDSMQKVLKKAS